MENKEKGQNTFKFFVAAFLFMVAAPITYHVLNAFKISLESVFWMILALSICFILNWIGYFHLIQGKIRRIILAVLGSLAITFVFSLISFGVFLVTAFIFGISGIPGYDLM